MNSPTQDSENVVEDDLAFKGRVVLRRRNCVRTVTRRHSCGYPRKFIITLDIITLAVPDLSIVMSCGCGCECGSEL